MSPNVHPIVVALALLVGAPACAGTAKPTDAPATNLEPAAATPAPESPETTFVRLEERLGRTPWRLRFTIEAEGAVVASLAGMLELGDGDMELRAVGSFAGAAQDVRLWTEGDRLRSASTSNTSSTPALDVPRPAELESAVVVGMARMGLLHNLAMLVGGRPPDHADGGVREWVRATELERREGDGETGIAFVLVVAGERAAHGTLWLDARGLPVRRELTVTFSAGPEGPTDEMRVVERYEWLEPLPAAGPTAG